MDTNNTETDAKTPAKLSPLAHVASLLGLVIISGASEIYQNGVGKNLFTSTLPRMLGAAVAPLFVGALVAALMGKSKTYSLIYGVAYVAAFALIMARI